MERSANRHSFEKRYSEMTPEERQVESRRIIALARRIIDQEKVIEGEVEQVDVLGDCPRHKPFEVLLR